MRMTLALLRADLAEVGLECVALARNPKSAARWRIRPVNATVQLRPTATPGHFRTSNPGTSFRTVGVAVTWWRRYTARLALRGHVVTWMEAFLASATSDELDLSRASFDQGRQWGIDPPRGLTPCLLDALVTLNQLDHCPCRDDDSGVIMKDKGWRQRAIGAWRACQRDDGWATDAFYVTCGWARTMLDAEINRRIGTMPPAANSARPRARL
jgi:hypothetical protein